MPLWSKYRSIRRVTRKAYFFRDPGHLEEYVYFRGGIEAKFASPPSNYETLCRVPGSEAIEVVAGTKPERTSALDSNSQACHSRENASPRP